ncbi:DsrE family protein [Acidihalobacter prosperus]
MAKLAIVLLSDMKDPVKVEMGLRFATVALKENRLEDIRFFFFGPGVRVPGQLKDDENLRPVLDELLASGITTLACIFNARSLGEENNLRESEIQMQAIGSDLVNVVNQGYQLMTF